jgi:hypothetical protein
MTNAGSCEKHAAYEERTSDMRTCRNCNQELPLKQFERFPTGTHRRICRHCHYVLHQRDSYRKWLLRERARVIMANWNSR